MNQVISLFARFARALVRLVIGAYEDPKTVDETRQAVREAAEEVREAVLAWVEESAPDYYGDANTLEQEDVRDGYLKRLAEDLAGAVTDMERDADAYLLEMERWRLESILAAESGGGGSGLLRKEANEFRREIEGRGVRVRDRAGRSWDPEKWAEMVLLTVTSELRNSGVLHRVALEGAPGVLVNDAKGGDTDGPCVEADGERWSVAYALGRKLEHPRCSRAFTPLAADDKTPLDRK